MVGTSKAQNMLELTSNNSRQRRICGDEGRPVCVYGAELYKVLSRQKIIRLFFYNYSNNLNTLLFE